MAARLSYEEHKESIDICLNCTLDDCVAMTSQKCPHNQLYGRNASIGILGIQHFSGVKERFEKLDVKVIGRAADKVIAQMGWNKLPFTFDAENT